MTAPRVSVVMPVFNRAWCVAEAIDSVLATGAPDLELVIVDDGSTDGTADILARYAECEPRRVRVVAHSGRANLGISRSRNLGASQARGIYLAFLDSDDLYHPGRFAHAPAWLDRHPAHDACIEPFERADIDGARRELVTHLAPVPQADAGWLDAMLFSTIYWHTSVITLRRCAWPRFGGFDPRLALGEDVALWLRLAAAGTVGVAQDRVPVSLVRAHARHSWAGADRRTEHAIYLRVLDALCSWIARQPGLPQRVHDMARTRLRQSLVELLLDAAVPRRRRLGLWTEA
ncbi:glycosyltransferase, partial [Ramlibacter sp.]|uniref:glycosyltransferase family 2 protein n=1 Tax=Ramlibacter sp. TaxID=1917967 RepID=UPI00185C5703